MDVVVIENITETVRNAEFMIYKLGGAARYVARMVAKPLVVTVAKNQYGTRGAHCYNLVVVKRQAVNTAFEILFQSRAGCCTQSCGSAGS